MPDDQKYMSIKEFRESGYLQEINRRFLHPLGIAIEVVQHANGQEYFGKIWDAREDPEGMIFGEGMIDPAKAEFIYEQMDSRARDRMKALGWFEQPIPSPPTDG